MLQITYDIKQLWVPGSSVLSKKLVKVVDGKIKIPKWLNFTDLSIDPYKEIRKEIDQLFIEHEQATGKRLKAGHRPTCINYGCTNLANSKSGSLGWRIHCSTCQVNVYNPLVLWKQQIIPFKTFKCSNYKDQHLGFPCSMNPRIIKQQIQIFGKAVRMLTDVDHKNGNPYDNRIVNLDEICNPCHRLKSITEGDHNPYKNK